MMKVSNDPRVDQLIRALPKTDSSRIVHVIELFKDYGFGLSALYLKKLTTNLWELRAGRFRLLYGLVEGKAIITNLFLKKTQKTPKRELELAQKRLKEYQ